MAIKRNKRVRQQSKWQHAAVVARLLIQELEHLHTLRLVPTSEQVRSIQHQVHCLMERGCELSLDEVLVLSRMDTVARLAFGGYPEYGRLRGLFKNLLQGGLQIGEEAQ